MLKIIKAIVLTIWFIFAVFIMLYMCFTDTNAEALVPLFIINLFTPLGLIICDKEIDYVVNSINNISETCKGFGFNIETLDLLYDLIKADLVEKVD